MANKNLKNMNKVSNINNDVAFNKLQNELKEKSKMLNKEFTEKEERIKNKYLNEITNITKKIDELKIDNDNLRNEISKYKMEIDIDKIFLTLVTIDSARGPYLPKII